MIVKGRGRHALILSTLWALAAAASFYLTEPSEAYLEDALWVMTLISLLLFIIGLAAFFGKIRVFFPYMLLSKKDLSVYNIKKISFILGLLMISVSYMAAFFITGGISVLVMIICLAVILEIGTFYTFVSKRFRADNV
jgi:hypothetical protein